MPRKVRQVKPNIFFAYFAYFFAISLREMIDLVYPIFYKVEKWD
jgi:hypothetical protein